MSLYTTSKTRYQIYTRKRRKTIHLAIRKSQGSPAERVHFRLRLMYVQATPVRTHGSYVMDTAVRKHLLVALLLFWFIHPPRLIPPDFYVVVVFVDLRLILVCARGKWLNQYDTLTKKVYPLDDSSSSISFLILIFNFFLLVLRFPFLHSYPTFFQWSFAGPIITVRSSICVILLRRSCTNGTHAIEDRERILGIRRISRNRKKKKDATSKGAMQ